MIKRKYIFALLVILGVAVYCGYLNHLFETCPSESDAISQVMQEPKIKELLANADIISYRSYITAHFGYWQREVDIDVFDRNNLTLYTIHGCVSGDGIEELRLSNEEIIIERVGWKSTKKRSGH